MGCNFPTSVVGGGSDPPGFDDAAAARLVEPIGPPGIDNVWTPAIRPLSQTIQLPILSGVS
eukprot:4101095-Heterocapsa_arctica.AAC.1